ncbi:MAG: putative S-layer protein [archaeon]
MKTKNLCLISLSILFLVMFLNFASAAVIAEWSLTTDGSASNINSNLNAGSFTGTSEVTFTDNGASASNWATGVIDGAKYFQITLSPKTGYDLTISNINFGERKSTTGPDNYQVQYSKNSDFSSSTIISTQSIPEDTDERSRTIDSLNINVNEGETIYFRWFSYNAESTVGTWRINDGTLNVEGTLTSVVSDEEPSEINSCELTGNSANNLRIKSIDITDKGMNGGSESEFGDDDAWFLLDDIEVEIKVENKGNEDIDNVEIEWGLWNTQSNEWIIELDDEKDFDVKDDDSEIITISFNLEDSLDIDLDELDDGKNYRFYVIANGYDNEIEEDVCASDFEEIEIIIESDFVVLYDFQYPEKVSCGGDFQIIADAWNIGDSDQDDVYVKVFNSELGINEKVEIGDIDAFDKEDFEITLEIPEDTDEKIYAIDFEVYNEDDDIFETDFDDDLAEFRILLTVSGSCSIEKSALVSASLESGGKAGEELVVRATIVNTGSGSTTYNINAKGYSDWADSAEVNPDMVLLKAGESKDILLTLKVNANAVGEKNFDIELTSDNEVILKQPVSVSIEGSQGLKNIIPGDNLYLWGIGALNIILVIIIIIVAIRVARK